MSEWYLDYSASKLSSSTIRNTPVGPQGEKATGVVRYIDSPDRCGRKHTNQAEWNELTRAGLACYLVFEVSTGDADGGFARGRDYALRAKAGADWLGYHGPIFFSDDRPVTPNSGLWRGYLDGATSVLGIGRVGAYGFKGAMDLAIGHATYFWQAGRRSDVRPHVHLWQDNNFQPSVGGIATDRNLVIKPIGGEPAVVVDSARTPVVDEESIVELPAGTHVQKRIFAAGRPHYLWWLASQPNKVTVHGVAYIKRTSQTSSTPEYGPVGQPGYPDIRGVIDPDRPGPWKFADDVSFVWVEYSCAAESTVAIG